jgi:hypothetical protein
VSEPMICPACGAEMNFHAEKLVYSETDLSAQPAMGGRIEEVHTCPGCGRTESRVSARQ